jgi:hypothetical protein
MSVSAAETAEHGGVRPRPVVDDPDSIRGVYRKEDTPKRVDGDYLTTARLQRGAQTGAGAPEESFL